MNFHTLKMVVPFASRHRTVICRTKLYFLIFLIVHPAFGVVPTSRNRLSPSNVPDKKEEICGDIDIRNSVSNFAKLQNCTVIEGFLQILLIDHGVANDYVNLSFPKLREITNFFLLYRVSGLRTLRNLFPNLAVIRGSNLFHNYAFVVYEMMSLQEIGLPSLTHILRGSVNIQKNPQLCYIDTIDWDLIATSGKGGHFIKSNKEANQCPNDCPQDVACPLHRTKKTKLCWNRYTCQKVCDESCGNRTCDENGHCCNELCLGGCTGQTPSDCMVCSKVVFHNRCMVYCPAKTYEYAERRCITDNECQRMPNRVEREGTQVTYWKVFEHKCLPECPSGYMENEADRHSCRKCEGHCPKVCTGLHVDSVAAAQMLRGCTRISGALEIQISGGTNVVHELEENLSMIEEVDDYIKVVRSFPLVSLNFLKNLRKIHGKKKENTHYSLVVLDNHNLQELMDFKSRKNVPLQIVSGKILFHQNPKLCMSKIRELKDFAHLPDWDDHEVSSTSNGDKVACDIRPLKVWVEMTSEVAAVIHWENFLRNLSDQRSLLGYVVSYKEAPYANVTLYDGRDACGTDSWKVDDVAASANIEDLYESHILPHLKPFTQYAIFVRTYTVVTEKQGAQSRIIYFMTKPAIPTAPLDLKATSDDHSEFVLSWLPPSKPNGNVTHYIITGYYEKDDQSFLDRRDYCREPLTIPDRKKTDTVNRGHFRHENRTNVWVKPTNLPEQCCECPKEKGKLKAEEEDVEAQIQFEDILHNRVYVKRLSVQSSPMSGEGNVRRRRFISPNQQERTNNISKATLAPLPPPSEATTVSPESRVKPAFIIIVNMSTKATVKLLRHFSEYTIEVVACHNADSSGHKLCSAKAFTTARTAPRSGADNINTSTTRVLVLNDTTGKVQLGWDEPVDPNGLVVSYHIEYRRTNVENYKPIQECITHKRYRARRGYTLTELGPGNYSVRIRTTSLAGNGEWTTPVYFIIVEPSGGMHPGQLAAIVASSVIVVIFILAGSAVFVFKRKLSRSMPNAVLYASVNPEYISTGSVYVPDEWEVPRSKISIVRELGQGSFGMVYEGIAKDVVKGEPIVKVAVKTVNDSATIRERIEFLNEASVMKAFSCHHVVKLIGVVSKGQPTLVIMELMGNGDLKSYLRQHRPEDSPLRQPPTLKRTFQMAMEISDGMAYLAAKKFVHRDLAARNCMVADDLTVKVGDFGMTRDIYETDYYRKDGKGMLPVRWMAPESLKDGVFTSQSDVWSYGVVLWEMVTLASQPYQGMSNNQVLTFIVNGGLMDRPIGCPEKVFDLMVRCWERNPKMRPTFRELTRDLLVDADEKFHQNAFYFTSEAERSGYSAAEVEDVTPSTPLKLYMDTDEVSMCSHNSDIDENDDEDDVDSNTNTADVDGVNGEQDADSAVHFAIVKEGTNEDGKMTNYSSDGSKGMSIQSSEGSKGSKISTHSANGGLVNGHVHFPVAKSTQC